MRSQKKPSRLNILVSGLLLAQFGALLICLAFWESAPDKPTEQTVPQTTQVPATTTAPPETTLPRYTARRLNFLLVGRDLHGEGENGRSDAMILCSVDTGGNTVTMISFLRDLYLPIPGHGSDRLNAAYSWGGAELLKQTLAENFGVGVDVTLEIDFEGFEGMIDLLGGVDVELTEREASHLNKSEGWSLTEGVNHLDGSQALAYSRIRKLDSDFVRTERQQNVLRSLLGKYQSVSPETMLRVTDSFLDQSTSDHTDEELLAYALELYGMLSEPEVRSARIPAEGTFAYATIRGMSVLDADIDENRAILEDLLGSIDS